MLNTAEQAVPAGRLVRKGAARTAIVQAGRRVAERDGMDQFSLSAVATEAGFGPSTVFGHFRNKDELLAAIVAEDLAAMAALMRDNAEAEKDASEPPAASEGVARPHGEESLDAYSPKFAPLSLDDASRAEFPEPTPAKSLEADTFSSGRSPVDAWLERRLRTFEHGLADLEHRMKETEASTSWAVAISKDTTKSVTDKLELLEERQNDTLQNLNRRMEETERRQRGTTAEMRAAMNDTATRIEILEAARRTDQNRGTTASLPDSPAAQPYADEPQAQTVSAHDQDTYVAAAQRAASAAAQLADMDEKKEEETASAWQAFAGRRVRVQRKHYLIAAGAAGLAFVMGAFFAFYVGEARGHELAAAVAVSTSTPHLAAQPAHRVAMTASRPSQQTAASPLETIAQSGNAAAQLIVGLKYLKGDGVATDQPRAAQWIRRAAEQQEPMAQYWLATMYEHGDGIAADSAEAVKWYEAAAGQGNRKAMHALGVAYAEGRGTSKDYSQAARWFAKAASLGLMNSQFNLAVLYERGLGVPQSLPDAYKWYAVAAAQGDQESGTRIEVLKTQLNADDLSAAERAAMNFQADAAPQSANTIPVLAQFQSNTPH